MATTTYSKQDLKNPDVVTMELKKGFQWTTEHSKLVLGVIVLLLVVGIGATAYNYMGEQSELKAQESYFKAERDFLKRKESFDKYLTSSAALENFNKTKNDKKADKKAKPAADTAPKVEGEASTGDFTKDYGTQATALENVIQTYPNSHAAQMAALILSEVQMQYKKADAALADLGKVKVQNDLLSGMVLLAKGSAQSETGDCKSAVDTWAKALQISAAQSLQGQIYLKQGLCFEALGDKTKAAEAYGKVSKDSKDGALAKSADQYLRLMHANN